MCRPASKDPYQASQNFDMKLTAKKMRNIYAPGCNFF
jgi:hypothetical protein